MVYIDKVRYGIDQHGCEIITNVKWTNDLYEPQQKNEQKEK